MIACHVLVLCVVCCVSQVRFTNIGGQYLYGDGLASCDSDEDGSAFVSAFARAQVTPFLSSGYIIHHKPTYEPFARLLRRCDVIELQEQRHVFPCVCAVMQAGSRSILTTNDWLC